MEKIEAKAFSDWKRLFREDDSSMTGQPTVRSAHTNKGFMHWIRQRRINKNWQFYVMLILPLAWYFIFCYMPMPGVILGFKKYKALLGIC